LKPLDSSIAHEVIEDDIVEVVHGPIAHEVLEVVHSPAAQSNDGFTCLSGQKPGQKRDRTARATLCDVMKGCGTPSPHFTPPVKPPRVTPRVTLGKRAVAWLGTVEP
jgi:hypothetical protein